MPDLIRRCLRFLTSHVGVSDIFMTPVPQAEVIEFEVRCSQPFLFFFV